MLTEVEGRWKIEISRFEGGDRLDMVVKVVEVGIEGFERWG